MFKRQKKLTVPNFKTYEGFERLYSLYAEKMYEIGVSQTGDEEITKEIVQEIFKSIWERRESLEIKGFIEHYLMRALKLKIIDHFRGQYSCKIVKKENLCDERCGFTNCTEETVAVNELEVNINLLVDRLPYKCRKAFRMRHDRGMSNKEIASALLISERAVAYNIAKAKEFLKEELQDHIDHLNPAI